METKIQKPELTEYRIALNEFAAGLRQKVSRLPISQGMFVLLDESQFQMAVQHSPWFCQVTEGGLYARTVINGEAVYLHQLIMDSKNVGFHNKITLDCRRENLFALGRRGVMQNRTGKAETTSNYKGVFKRKNEDVWCAQLKDKYGKLFLGRHKSEKMAALVYDAAARICFGKHAYFNFVDEDEEEARLIAKKYILRRKRKQRASVL